MAAPAPTPRGCSRLGMTPAAMQRQQFVASEPTLRAGPHVWAQTPRIMSEPVSPPRLHTSAYQPITVPAPQGWDINLHYGRQGVGGGPRSPLQRFSGLWQWASKGSRQKGPRMAARNQIKWVWAAPAYSTMPTILPAQGSVS